MYIFKNKKVNKGKKNNFFGNKIIYALKIQFKNSI